MLLKNILFLFGVLFCSCSKGVRFIESELNDDCVKIEKQDLFKCSPEELFNKYPLKKYSWKERKKISQSLIIGTTTQQEVIDIFGIDSVGRSNPPVIDSLIYHCKKSDPEYPGDGWLKFLEFKFNEKGKLVNYYEVTVPYPVPH
mgnify:CR=1 FL=1